MSLEERTLVIRNFGQNVTKQLLLELFTQVAPVIKRKQNSNSKSLSLALKVLNVVLRTDFAFIEFEHKVSVGYALALLEGIHLFGQPLHLEPKLRSDASFYSFSRDMESFNHVMALNPDYFLQYMPTTSASHSGRPYNRQSYGNQNRYSERKRHSNNFQSFR